MGYQLCRSSASLHTALSELDPIREVRCQCSDTAPCDLLTHLGQRSSSRDLLILPIQSLLRRGCSICSVITEVKPSLKAAPSTSPCVASLTLEQPPQLPHWIPVGSGMAPRSRIVLYPSKEQPRVSPSSQGSSGTACSRFVPCALNHEQCSMVLGRRKQRRKDGMCRVNSKLAPSPLFYYKWGRSNKLSIFQAIYSM